MIRSIPRYEQFARVATVALLLASMAAFARGWIRSEMLAKIPWEADGAYRALVLSIAYWAVYGATFATGQRALAAKLAGVSMLALAAFAGPMPVIAAAFVVASGCALGHAILARGGRIALRLADLPACTGVGLGVLAAVLAPLGYFNVNTPFTYFVLLAAPLAWQGPALLRLLRPALVRTQELRARDVVLLGAVGNLGVLYVAAALLPEVGNDALAFHLLIAEYVRDHGHWHYDVHRSVLAVMPIAVDFLYAAGVMFGGETAARLVNVLALMVTLALVHASVRARGETTTALLAVLLAAASPLALLESSTLFIDNTWALLVVAGIVALLQFANGGDGMRLIAAGAVLGASMSAKTISAAALPAVVLLLAIALAARGAGFPWRALAIAVLVGGLLAAPPYVIAWHETGNPVFPFMNAWFRSPLYPPEDVQVFPGRLDLLLPYRFTFYSNQYVEALPGTFGFTFLLLGPALAIAALAWGRREGLAMMFAVLSFGVVVVTGVAYYLRYLYPAVFLLAIAFGVAIAGMRSRSPGLARAMVATAVASVAANVLFLPAGYAPARSFALAPIVDEAARHDYVSAWAHQRHFVPVLNGLPDDAAVAFFGGKPYFAGLRRPAFADSTYMRPFLGRVAELRTREDLLRLIREFDLGYIVLEAKLGGELRTLVRSVAAPMFAIDTSTLYRVDARARFPVELVRGSGLRIGDDAWHVHGEPRPGKEAGAMLVDVDNVLWQRVPVAGGEQYRYAVDARCHEQAGEVRLQVIWHRLDGSTSLSFRSVPCLAQWTEEQAVFTAPIDAESAVVFAIGHGRAAVEVRDVSFRGR